MPATGAGVERLFNSARDICHYRRGSLNEKTIQDLMMFMCSQKFTLDNKQFSYRGNIPVEEDNQVTREVESALKATEDEFDPISDCEEDAAEEDNTQAIEINEESEGESEPETSRMDGILMNVHEEPEEDVELPQLPPPIIQLGERSQKRSSGRVTIPSSRLEGYQTY